MSFDYQVYLLDGMTVNEAVTENEDGSYTIFVNKNLCESKQIKAINSNRILETPNFRGIPGKRYKFGVFN